MINNELLESCKNLSEAKVLIRISDCWVQAWMAYDGHPIPGLLMKAEWPFVDDDTPLLKNIEDAIYDNSVILDDFDTLITIVSQCMLYFPLTTSEDDIYKAMQETYAVEADEVWITSDGLQQAAFYLCKGLKGFVNRTFSGVKVVPEIGLLKNAFMKGGRLNSRVYADLNDKCMGMLAFSGFELVHLSMRKCASENDCAYFIFLLWHFLNLKNEDAELYISGPKDKRDSLMKIMRKYLNYVLITPLPGNAESQQLPTSVALYFNNLFN